MARKGGVTETLNKNCLIAPMGGQGYLQLKSERFNGPWALNNVASYDNGDQFESSEILKVPGMSGLSSIKIFCSKQIGATIHYRTVGDGRGAPTGNWTQLCTFGTASAFLEVNVNTAGISEANRALFYNSDMQNREFRVAPRIAGAAADWAVVVIEFINI